MTYRQTNLDLGYGLRRVVSKKVHSDFEYYSRKKRSSLGSIKGKNVSYTADMSRSVRKSKRTKLILSSTQLQCKCLPKHCPNNTFSQFSNSISCALENAGLHDIISNISHEEIIEHDVPTSDCTITAGDQSINETNLEPGVKILHKPANDIVEKNTSNVESESATSSGTRILCSICHKLLKPNCYRQHLVTHNGIKPYTCKICGASFTRNGDVDRHVRIVHNKEKPFKCTQCLKAFGTEKCLQRHVTNHSQPKFLVCSTCDFRFSKQEYWENHVRFIHPMVNDIDTSQVAIIMNNEYIEGFSLEAIQFEGLDKQSNNNSISVCNNLTF